MLTELWRVEQAQAVGHRVIAVAAALVTAVAAGGFGVAVQADADPDAEAAERFQHGPAEQRAVGLDRDVQPCRYAAPQGPVSPASHSAPASSGSPPCRMTSTLDRPCGPACSSMRSATSAKTTWLIRLGCSRHA